MKNIAPHIVRQRLLIEGFYSIDVTREVVEDFFVGITSDLGLKPYSKPIIYSPEGLKKADNQGFDAFIPLIDSGISLYVWSHAKFLSTIIYTCKNFDEERAVNYIKQYFAVATEKLESLSF